jgi:hypothetical protein
MQLEISAEVNTVLPHVWSRFWSRPDGVGFAKADAARIERARKAYRKLLMSSSSERFLLLSAHTWLNIASDIERCLKV